MKKTVFLYLFILPTISWGQTSVQAVVNTFKDYWAFKNAGISITVKNISDDYLVASYNSDLALCPASTVKLFSTASAFEILGAEYKPKTQLYTNGKIIPNGVLSGDLYLRALGDPTLGSKYFYSDGRENQYLDDWMRDIKTLGIKEIQGKVIVDGSAFGYQGCPEGWTWGDMGNYYGAGPSGVVINDNILNYYFQTAGVGEKTTFLRTEPEIKELKLMNLITGEKISGDESIILGAPFAYDYSAIGSLPYGRKEFKVKGSLPDPERLLAQKLYDALVKEQIKVSAGFDFNRNRMLSQIENPPYKNMTLLKQWEGNTVEQIAFHTNMKSVNLFAEQLVCLIGYEKEGIGSTEKGMEVIQKYWKDKLDVEHLHLKDGSGLSRTNALSSHQFCKLLKYMSKTEKFSIFKSTLPTAGQTGTLSSVSTGQVASGRVFAKSGTMNRIKSYAGYVKSKSGKDLCFAIIINNYDCSNAATVEKIEEIFNAMAIY